MEEAQKLAPIRPHKRPSKHPHRAICILNLQKFNLLAYAVSFDRFNNVQKERSPRIFEDPSNTKFLYCQPRALLKPVLSYSSDFETSIPSIYREGNQSVRCVILARIWRITGTEV